MAVCATGSISPMLAFLVIARVITGTPFGRVVVAPALVLARVTQEREPEALAALRGKARASAAGLGPVRGLFKLDVSGTSGSAAPSHARGTKPSRRSGTVSLLGHLYLGASKKCAKILRIVTCVSSFLALFDSSSDGSDSDSASSRISMSYSSSSGLSAVEPQGACSLSRSNK